MKPQNESPTRDVLWWMFCRRGWIWQDWTVWSPLKENWKDFFRVLQENCQDYILIWEWREWNFFFQAQVKAEQIPLTALPIFIFIFIIIVFQKTLLKFIEELKVQNYVMLSKNIILFEILLINLFVIKSKFMLQSNVLL